MTEESELLSGEHHYFFTSETPHTDLTITNWPPSLFGHAATAGVFAAGDDLTDSYCFDSNLIQTPYDISLDMGPAGAMFATTAAGTPSITTESQYYLCTDVAGEEQGALVEFVSSGQNGAHLTSAQHE